MLPLTVQDIITRVQRIFGDEAGVQITDQDIINWINDGQEEVVTNNEGLMETTATADSVIGQASYNFPSDCATLRSLQYKGFRVKYMSFSDFDQYLDGYNAPTGTNPYGQGIPTVFMIWEGKFQVFPPPNEAVANGFKIFYIRHPAQVTTTADIPEVPVEYHKALVDYCLQQAYEVDEDSQKQQIKGADFQNKMMRLSEKNKSTQEAYPTITTLPEDEQFHYNSYWGY